MKSFIRYLKENEREWSGIWRGVKQPAPADKVARTKWTVQNPRKPRDTPVWLDKYVNERMLKRLGISRSLATFATPSVGVAEMYALSNGTDGHVWRLEPIEGSRLFTNENTEDFTKLMRSVLNYQQVKNSIVRKIESTLFHNKIKSEVIRQLYFDVSAMFDDVYYNGFADAKRIFGSCLRELKTKFDLTDKESELILDAFNEYFISDLEQDLEKTVDDYIDNMKEHDPAGKLPQDSEYLLFGDWKIVEEIPVIAEKDE